MALMADVRSCSSPESHYFKNSDGGTNWSLQIESSRGLLAVDYGKSVHTAEAVTARSSSPAPYFHWTRSPIRGRSDVSQDGLLPTFSVENRVINDNFGWLRRTSLRIDYWILFIVPLALLYALRWMWVRLRARSRFWDGNCPGCGYPLYYSGRRCPECGLVSRLPDRIPL